MKIDTVSIAGLNTHWGCEPDGSAYALTDACRALGTDVVCLQEVWTPGTGPSGAATTAAALGYKVMELPLTNLADIDGFRVVGDASEARGSWGLALLTTLPIAAQRTIDLGQAPGDTVRRAAQVATLETPSGRQLHVVNTHLSHRPYASPFQLRRLITHLRQIPRCVIVGDLNMVGPVASLVARRRRAVRTRTWPAHNPVAQLDHVLTTRDIRVVHARSLASVGSDHLPVHVQLAIS